MGVAGRRPGGRRLGVPAAAGGVALSAPVFSLRNTVKSYTAGGTEFRLFIPHLDIERGSKQAFVGESGAGKSTLLELLSMILKPGQCERFGFSPTTQEPVRDVAATWDAGDADRLTDLRSRHIGYVLQNGGLLPYLTVRQNINLSRRLLELPLERVADRWADKLNIAPQLEKLPSELSVGQRQRAAIARALAHDPPVLIADEPTAALDPLTAQRIMDLLAGLADELDVTLIVATHALELMRRRGFKLIDHRIDAAGENSMSVTVSNAPGDGDRI